MNKYKLQLYKFVSVPVSNNLLFSALSRGIRTAVWGSLRKTASSRQKRNPSASAAASPTARTGLHNRRWVPQVPCVHVGDLLAFQGVWLTDVCICQVRINGKHRKSSSQPSSCSQNTETSSSSTPEPNHESSDNEGQSSSHKQTLLHSERWINSSSGN